MGRTMTAQPATQVLEAIEGTSGAVAEHAARTLAAGGLVAVPTETAYGLGADATTATAGLADRAGRIDLIVGGGARPRGLEPPIIACLDRPVLLGPGRGCRPSPPPLGRAIPSCSLFKGRISMPTGCSTSGRFSPAVS